MVGLEWRLASGPGVDGGVGVVCRSTRNTEKGEHMNSRMVVRLGFEQGVIGDTYHYKSDKMEASTLDTPEKDIPVAAHAQVVYPVFPDSAYELPTLFSAPRFAFPASFIHDIIVSRKRLALHVAPPAVARA
jgi:hypothetical protein